MTLSWQVQGTENVLIEVWREDTEVLVQLLDFLPTTGTAAITLPANITGHVRFVIWGVDRSQYRALVPLWARIVGLEQSVAVWQSPVTDSRTQAAFQQYDHGFMVWRADTGSVMVFGGQGGGQVLVFRESIYAHWPNMPVDFDIPPGRVRPVNAFGKVWAHSQTARDIIGFATGQEQGYQAAIGQGNTAPVTVSLPDGRVLMINGSSWQF